MAGNSLAKAQKIHDVAKDWMKGNTKAEIAGKHSISVRTVNEYIREWEAYIEKEAADNQDMLENYLENTFKFHEEIKMLTSEAWEVVEVAKENGAMGTKLQALRLAKDLTETKARLFQLLQPRMDSGYIERQKKVERVNSILSGIMRDVISECSRCKPLAWEKLQAAYEMIPQDSQEETVSVDE